MFPTPVGIIFRLSLFHWAWTWIAFKAALWTTVHDWLSTSYTAISRDTLVGLIFLVYLFRGAPREGEGLRATLKNWSKHLWKQATDAAGIAFIGACLFVVALFLVKFHETYRIFVSQRPQVGLSWGAQTHGFEWIPGVTPPPLTHEYLKQNRQYVGWIRYDKKYDVPISLSVLFQFPYPVAMWEANSWGVTSPPMFGPNLSPLPLYLRGQNFQFFGQQQHRNWVLNVGLMEPGSKIRILVVLNSNAQGMVIQQSFGKSTGEPPEATAIPSFGPIRPSNDPLNEFIRTSIGFTYGHQVGDTQGYAPFRVAPDTTVSAGKYELPPKNLSIFFEGP